MWLAEAAVVFRLMSPRSLPSQDLARIGRRLSGLLHSRSESGAVAGRSASPIRHDIQDFPVSAQAAGVTRNRLL